MGTRNLPRVRNFPVHPACAYAWCPLVMKEFANSGHVDALAVFLTVAALLGLVRVARAKDGTGLLAAVLAFGLLGLLPVALLLL